MNTMTKIILSAVMVFTMTIANAQSKKEQIENLTFSLDSLNQLLSNQVISEQMSFEQIVDTRMDARLISIPHLQDSVLR